MDKVRIRQGVKHIFAYVDSEYSVYDKTIVRLVDKNNKWIGDFFKEQCVYYT